MRTPHIFRPRAALLVAVLCGLVVGSFAFTGIGLYRSQQDACQARDTSLQVMYRLLVSARASTDRDPTVTKAAKAKSDRFVDAALAQIQQAKCR